MTILQATVNLVPVPTAPVVVALGYPDMPTAADAVPALLAHKPLAVEGLDAQLVDVVRRHHGPAAVPELPAGGGWLLVEVGAARGRDRRRRARPRPGPGRRRRHRRRPGGPGRGAGRRPVAHPGRRRRAGRAHPGERAGVAGLGGRRRPAREAGRLPARLHRPDARAGRGRAAVRPLRRRVRARAPGPAAGDPGRDRAVAGVPRGLRRPGGRLRRVALRRARRRAGPLGAAGRACTPRRSSTCSGRSRPSSTPRTTSTPASSSTPPRSTPTCAGPYARRTPARGGFAFTEDGGDFATAVHRCTGVGKCRADTSAAGGFMCPSYQATKDEKDVTRGRARVLAGADQRLARPGLELPGRHRLPRPVPVVQGLLGRLPRRGGHGQVQVRGPLPRLQGQAPPAQPLPPGPAAPLDPDAHRRPAAGEAGQHRAQGPAAGAGRALGRRHGHPPPRGHLRRGALLHLVEAADDARRALPR